MTASEAAQRFDIWLVYLYFTDHPDTGKVRPVLVVDSAEGHIAVAKITSSSPREGFIGEYAISQWQESGLNVPSTVRCSQVFEIAGAELLREAPIGRLQPNDIDGVTNALIAAGFYKQEAQTDSKRLDSPDGLDES
jgi:mRNA-degrading endonuclease toxin of MazEF toxin-antitoxin module